MHRPPDLLLKVKGLPASVGEPATHNRDGLVDGRGRCRRGRSAATGAGRRWCAGRGRHSRSVAGRPARGGGMAACPERSPEFAGRKPPVVQTFCLTGRGHRSPRREPGDCDVADRRRHHAVTRRLSLGGMANGMAMRPDVPALGLLLIAGRYQAASSPRLAPWRNTPAPPLRPVPESRLAPKSNWLGARATPVSQRKL